MTKAWVLGLHIGHDRSAAIILNGQLVGHIAQERLDRIKHSNSANLPLSSINALIKQLNLSKSDLIAIGISYTNVEIARVIDQLGDEIRESLDLRDIPVLGCSHHQAHALSTYHTSPFDRCLILVADGAGDVVGDCLEAESLYLGESGALQLLTQRLQEFPSTRIDRRNSFNPAYMSDWDARKTISLGRKYEQLTYMIGFGHGEAGKAMGLSSYGKPLFNPDFPAFNGLDFQLTYGHWLGEIDEYRLKLGLPWHRFICLHGAQIAALAQYAIESLVLQAVENAVSVYGETRLAVAGGLFLNCLMNHRILERTRVSQLHVIPAAGDDGQAIGAAFHAWNLVAGSASQTKEIAYLGLSYGVDAISERLKHFQLPYHRLPREMLVARVARDLADGKTVALLIGRSESGPRALCHRSLLAHPGYSEIKDDLNRLKGRESFRPFAPVVTVEDQFRYFDLKHSSIHMLFACNVRPEFRNLLPGITHVDGTARVQAVSENQHPFMHKLLRAFECFSGFPILINTSFNLAGEPLVESPHDAIVTYLASSIDVLVMEDFYVNSKESLKPRKPA